MKTIALAALLAAAVLSATGTVTSVSPSSLVVAAKDGKEMTFMLDENTKFVGKGVGDKTKGGRVDATAVIGEGDAVSVEYHEMGTMRHAALVRVTRKKQS
ncbi:MAG TPA: hypothetical protein VFA27_15740 [Vicinamibacterales bacterium]|nr:hypothetical protein [Vicinamibacterales bacterium]